MPRLFKLYSGHKARLMNIDLTPELENFLEMQVQSGRYASAGEAVTAALRLLKEHETAREAEVHPLHARVDEALVSLSRGEGEEGESYVEDTDGRLEESQEDERSIQR